MEAERNGFERDPWLYVYARNETAARKFFGAPEDWPCEFDHMAINGKGPVYRVKSEGLNV